MAAEHRKLVDQNSSLVEGKVSYCSIDAVAHYRGFLIASRKSHPRDKPLKTRIQEVAVKHLSSKFTKVPE